MKRLTILCSLIVLVLCLIPAAIGCQSLPVAAFVATKMEGKAPFNTVFMNMTEAASGKNMDEFQWDFGDGNTMVTTSVEETVSHEYTKAGNYTVTMKVYKEGDPPEVSQATLKITVTHGAIANINLEPLAVELDIGQKQQFSVNVADAYDNPIEDVQYSWAVPEEYGTMTDNGELTAGTTAGVFGNVIMVTATNEGDSVEAEASLTVKTDPLDKVTISPFTISAGDTVQFETTTEDAYGNPVTDVEMTWSVIDEIVGTISEDGLFTAETVAGEYGEMVTVEAKQGDIIKKETVEITINPAALEQIGIAPERIDLGIGQSQQYVVLAADKYGNLISGLDFTWNVEGNAGEIDRNGLFKSGNITGTYRNAVKVETSQNDITRSATADVTVDPDRIVYLSISDVLDADASLDLYSINIDGTDEKRLPIDIGYSDLISYSPDGRRIVFSDFGNMYLVNVDGDWQIPLLTDEKSFEPSWSTDGMKIAYQSWEHDPSEIYVMDVDGGNRVRLTDNSRYDDYPVWSPDGTKIAYISNAVTSPENTKIWVMDADGKNQKALTTGSYTDAFPQWSPDGTEILFHSDRSGIGTFGIYIMNADGSDIRALHASDEYTSAFPHLSPDGSKIVFSREEVDTESIEIYLMDRDGSNVTRLTDNSAFNFTPKWLPRKTGVLVTEASVIIEDMSTQPEPMTVQELTASATDAVVRIETDRPLGSGFIIESDGLILTNNHVIVDTEEVTVYLADGASYNGTVIDRDIIHDLALVRIEATDLSTLEIGDLGGVALGQQVVVLGYPLGQENLSVTSGLVSTFEFDSGRNTTWIQTDSAINPGNSGGPMLDLQGRVIGVVSMKTVGVAVEGVGFAISANTVNLYLPMLSK